MSNRINKGGIVFKPSINKARKPGQQSNPNNQQSNPLPTPPNTQQTPSDTQQNPHSQSDLNENNKRPAEDLPLNIQNPSQKRAQNESTNVGKTNNQLPSPESSQNHLQPQPKPQSKPDMSSSSPMKVTQPPVPSFNARFHGNQANNKPNKMPLSTRASQIPIKTRALNAVDTSLTQTITPLNSRATQSLSNRYTQPQSQTTTIDDEDDYGDDDDDNQSISNLKKEQSQAPSDLPEKPISSRMLRKNKIRKNVPLEEIWKDDPNASPIDPTTMTMAALCNDPGVGRLSSRVIDVGKKHREMKNRKKSERLKLRLMNEEDLRNDGGDDGTGRRRQLQDEEANRKEKEELMNKQKEEKKALKKKMKEEKRQREGVEEGAEESSSSSDDDDDDDDDNNNTQGPQMRMVDGKIVIDEQTLYVDRSANNEFSSYEHVDELDSDRFVNTNTWRGKGKGRSERWTKLETEMFYDALSRFGTDFEMISMLFKGRPRRVIKAKFSREEKHNSNRITEALKERKPFNLVEYGKLIGVDLSGPTPQIKIPSPQPQTKDEQIIEEHVIDNENENNDDEEIINEFGEVINKKHRPSTNSHNQIKRKQSKGPGGRDPEIEVGAEVVGVVEEGGNVVAT